MVQFVIGEVRDGILKQRVLGLDSHCVIPERAVTLSHHEEFPKGILLPVLREVIGAEFGYESSERQCNNTLPICADPVGYAVVKEAANDHGHLIVRNHLLMDKVIQTSVMELAHDRGRDVSCSQDWHFGRRGLFNGGHGSLIGRHWAKKSERTRTEGDYLWT